MRFLFALYSAGMVGAEAYLSSRIRYEVPVERHEQVPLPVFLVLSNLWVLPLAVSLLSADVFRRKPFPAAYGIAVALAHAALLFWLKGLSMKESLSTLGGRVIF